MTKEVAPQFGSDIRVVCVEDNRAGLQEHLVDLAYVTRGRAYALAEELEHEDLCLAAVDEAYRRVGLRRYRRIWLACSRSQQRAIGAAIAYRPLGLNLSFLENRCELPISTELARESARRIAHRLLAAAAPEYGSFEPGFIPVVTDAATAEHLVATGGRHIRQYAQASFLRAGYADWYRHAEGFYARILRRVERQSAPVVRAA